MYKYGHGSLLYNDNKVACLSLDQRMKIFGEDQVISATDLS